MSSRGDPAVPDFRASPNEMNKAPHWTARHKNCRFSHALPQRFSPAVQSGSRRMRFRICRRTSTIPVDPLKLLPDWDSADGGRR